MLLTKLYILSKWLKVSAISILEVKYYQGKKVAPKAKVEATMMASKNFNLE
jgi:hypoxanthine phosphoribosyltransferase